MRNNVKNKKPVEIEEPVVEQTVEAVEPEPVVEEPIVEPEPAVEETVKPKMGVVTECARLNVRKAPSANADILCTLDFMTEVMIDESESTNDFYKIYAENSVEGYCMKQFIAV